MVKGKVSCQTKLKRLVSSLLDLLPVSQKSSAANIPKSSGLFRFKFRLRNFLFFLYVASEMLHIFFGIGLDVNLTDGKYCVLSDGTEIAYPKPLKKAITKLRMFQYHNRHKQFGNRRKDILSSNNAKKYFQKVAKLHKKVADQRNDFLQKLTTFLAKKYYWLKIETLNISGMMANHKLAFHVADASFYRFKELLTHKMSIYGGYLESIDQWYPSSRLCHQCGNKKTDLTLKDRLYICDNPDCKPVCRDWNSAKNLEQAESEWIKDRIGSI